MLPECLIGNCNRHIILFDGEPVDGKYVTMVRNKTTTTNSVVVIVSRIWCNHACSRRHGLFAYDFYHLPYVCGI